MRMTVIFVGKQADWLFVANSAIAGVFCFSPPVKPTDVYVTKNHVTVAKLVRALKELILAKNKSLQSSCCWENLINAWC